MCYMEFERFTCCEVGRPISIYNCRTETFMLISDDGQEFATCDKLDYTESYIRDPTKRCRVCSARMNQQGRTPSNDHSPNLAAPLARHDQVVYQAYHPQLARASIRRSPAQSTSSELGHTGNSQHRQRPDSLFIPHDNVRAASNSFFEAANRTPIQQREQQQQEQLSRTVQIDQHYENTNSGSPLPTIPQTEHLYDGHSYFSPNDDERESLSSSTEVETRDERSSPFVAHMQSPRQQHQQPQQHPLQPQRTNQGGRATLPSVLNFQRPSTSTPTLQLRRQNRTHGRGNGNVQRVGNGTSYANRDANAGNRSDARRQQHQHPTHVEERRIPERQHPTTPSPSSAMTTTAEEVDFTRARPGYRHDLTIGWGDDSDLDDIHDGR
ncbi:hypothetical protein V8F33_004541 [Rhypophila sp. PSN 637]